MPRSKKSKLGVSQLMALVEATNLRSSLVIQHQNDLFANAEAIEKRVKALEDVPKQSPTERWLVARVGQLENRFDAHNRRVRERQEAKRPSYNEFEADLVRQNLARDAQLDTLRAVNKQLRETNEAQARQIQRQGWLINDLRSGLRS